MRLSPTDHAIREWERAVLAETRNGRGAYQPCPYPMRHATPAMLPPDPDPEDWPPFVEWCGKRSLVDEEFRRQVAAEMEYYSLLAVRP